MIIINSTKLNRKIYIVENGTEGRQVVVDGLTRSDIYTAAEVKVMKGIPDAALLITQSIKDIFPGATVIGHRAG